MKAPWRVETSRLVLRKPELADADAIYARYASDAEVTKYLSWPRHRSIEDTREFLAFSDSEWARWPAGPYLVESAADGGLLGSTGLAFEAPDAATTGYVLARDAWGRGYATEALTAIAAIADGLGIRTLLALCHPVNAASRRVLEKCGFAPDQAAAGPAEFPNLAAERRLPSLRYVRIRDGCAGAP